MLTNIITEILNGMPLEKYFAVLLYIFLGVLFKYALEQWQFRKRIKTHGGFKMATWINENKWRFVLGIIGIHIMAVFGPQMNGTPATIFVGFTSGMALDVVLDTFAKPKK